MRRFLAIDQSLSSTGVASWVEGDDLPTLETWAEGCTIATRAHAFIAMHREIGAAHRERPIHTIAYEQPIKVASDKVEKLIGLYGLAAHIESIAEIRRIATERIDARSWRRTFLGPERDRKKAGTEKLKRLAVERSRDLGMDPETDDQADAIGILDHFLHTQGIQPPWRIAHPFLFT